MRLLVREMPGRMIKDKVSNVTRLGRPDHCGRVGCLPCASSSPTPGSKGACWTKGPVYKVTCSTCREDGRVANYIGESGFSCYSRGANHKAGFRQEDPRSALWSHAVEHHGRMKGEASKIDMDNMFKMKLVDSHRSSSKRLISEAIRIESEVKQRDASNSKGSSAINNRIVMNSFRQWNQPGLIRSRASKEVNY